MGRRFSFSVALAALSFAGLATSGAAQDAPTALQPSSNWHLDMAENKCRLLRTFGPEESRTIFFLEQWDPSMSAIWGLAGPAVEDLRVSWDARFAFGPGGDTGEFPVADMDLGEQKLVSATTSIAFHPGKNAEGEWTEEDRDWTSDPRGLAHLDDANAAGISTFTLSQRGEDDIVLDLGPMDKPLAAMNVCMEDLVTHWGFDPERQRTVVSPPEIVNMKRVVRTIQSEYPAEALRKGAQAYFALRLTVDESGRVEACEMLNQTVAEDFDMRKHPCSVMQRTAEIEPARDAAGQPVRSYLAHRIFYRIR